MSQETKETGSSRFQWLETLTAIALGLVLLSLGWILVVSEAPGWLRLGSESAEVAFVVGLLTLTLALVSLVALLHTRSR